MNFPAATVAGPGVALGCKDSKQIPWRASHSFGQGASLQATTVKAENPLLNETPLGNHCVEKEASNQLFYKSGWGISVIAHLRDNRSQIFDRIRASKREEKWRSSARRELTMDLNANLEVSNITREIILPSPLCPPHVVTLSNNDQIMPPLYTSFLYFFKAMDNPSVELKQSLASSLAAFPPVAGRLIPRTPAHAGFDVHCDNQGSVFVEAQSSATLHHLLNTGHGDVRGSAMYQPSPVWKSLAPEPEDFVSGQESKPLLFIQVTRLSCGGAVLAVRLHHLVADGAAQSHFVASWAELTRGQEITAPPHLDRARMQAQTPPCPSFEHMEYLVHNQAPSFSSEAMAELTRNMPPMTSRIFEFLPEDLELLRERAKANADPGEPPFTAFQVLASHIWKHLALARGVKSSEVMKLGWAVDGRKRFTPPLPPTYFGNVNFYACAESIAGEVTSQSLQATAKTIQSATKRITHEYMQSALDLVETKGTPALVTASFIGPADLALTSWANFAAYQLDFGSGTPMFFAPPVYGFVQLVILLPHPRGHGAVNALVGMFEPQMQALLSDQEFYPLRPDPPSS